MSVRKKLKSDKEFTDQHESYELSEIKSEKSQFYDRKDIENNLDVSIEGNVSERKGIFITVYDYILWCFRCKKKEKVQDQLIDTNKYDSNDNQYLSNQSSRSNKTTQKIYIEEKKNLPKILCECGGIDINNQVSSNHECVLNCPWIIEGCLFSVSHYPLKKCNPNYQKIFGDHFRNHNDLDSKKVQVESPANNQSSDTSYQELKDDEVGLSSHTQNAERKKKCCDFPRGVQGCEEEVYANELQSHLESPKFLKKHMDLILN